MTINTCDFCISATKIELYVGDMSIALDDRLPALNQARFTRLGYVTTLYLTYVHTYNYIHIHMNFQLLVCLCK